MARVNESIFDRARARLAASKERFANGTELVKRDKDGKIIMPQSKRNIFQAASEGVERIPVSDSWLHLFF